MPKTSRSYREWQLKKLADPARAKRYLNSALTDSLEVFLVALGKVVQAHQVARVAKDAGLQRETLYRSFSEDGNPTLKTLTSVLRGVGLQILITEPGQNEISSETGNTTMGQSEIADAHRDVSDLCLNASLPLIFRGIEVGKIGAAQSTSQQTIVGMPAWRQEELYGQHTH